MRNSRIVHTSSLKHIIPRTGVVMWVWALQIPIKQQTNKWLYSVELAVFAYQMEKMNKVWNFSVDTSILNITMFLQWRFEGD